MRLEDFVDDQSLEALYQPLNQARGLPARVYSKDFFELENDCLFPRTWSAVAVGSQIPNAGDILPVQLGNWPIFLLRNHDGQITAFINICPHRGMRLFSNARSNCEKIRCPYHSWTYDLNGKLLSAPNYSGWKTDGVAQLDEKNIALKKIQTAVWNDLVLVNIDGNAPPFDDHRKPLDDLVRECGLKDLGDLRYARMWEHSYPGGWKTSVNGAMEAYHLPWGHPQAVRGIKTWDERILLHERCYTALYNQITLGEESSDAVAIFGGNSVGGNSVGGNSVGGTHTLPSIWKPTLNGEMRSLITNIFPTAIFVAGHDHFLHALFTPDGWNRTRLVLYFYYTGNAATDAALAKARQTVEEQWMTIERQDDDLVRYVEVNTLVRDRAGMKPHFSPYWEGAIHQFQKMVVEAIQEGQARNVR